MEPGNNAGPVVRHGQFQKLAEGPQLAAQLREE